MQSTDDNETWIIEAGDEFIEKRVGVGFEAMSPKERLIYWLWWTDYMMRNAGDFANADALGHNFQDEIASNALQLGLPFTAETYSLPRDILQQQYLERFDRVS